MNIELIAILVGFSIASLGFGAVSLIISCIAWSTVVGLKNSTHQIQYVPIGEDGMDKSQKEINDEFEDSMGLKYEENEYI